MDTLWNDIRYAARMLLKTRGITLIAIVTLALGIGANTAIFSLFDQILLRRLPVPNPEELVVLYAPGPIQGRSTSDESRRGGSFSYPQYKDLRDRNQVFAGLLARFGIEMNVANAGQTERVQGELVSGNYFETLGVRAAIGRTFSADDDKAPGAHPVAVLSHEFWVRRFGGNSGILNQTMLVNGHPLTIVGVTQPGFFGVQLGDKTDVFVPMMMKTEMTPGWDEKEFTNRKSYWLKIIGRVKPGLTREQAAAQLNGMYRSIMEEELPLQEGFNEETRKRFLERKVELVDGSHGRLVFQDDARQPLKLLLGMVGLVLLIACANVANLLIARAAAREKEIAVRLALGASRARLFRQLLTESLLLALAGAALGVLVASWTLDAMLQFMPADGEAGSLTAALNLRMLGFNFSLAVATGILFGIWPAWRASRPQLSSTLKDQASNVSTNVAHARFRKALVVAQVSLTVLLVITAGLFTRSLLNMNQENLGVRKENVVQFAVAPSLNGYTSPRSVALFQQLEDALRATPGILNVGVAQVAIFRNSNWGSNITVQGYQLQPDEDIQVWQNAIGPGFFSTLGVPLLQGREFTRQDVLGAPKVCIINQTLANRYFKDKNPLGMKIAFGDGPKIVPDIEVVGVVKDSKHANTRQEPRPFVFTPYAQDDRIGRVMFYARTDRDPVGMAAAIRREVQKLDANLPIFRLQTLESQIAETHYGERFVTMLSVSFGALAALLAAIGIYGVMAYTVERRTREIGIRMALGAQHTHVWQMILRDVGFMAVIGTAIGVPAALWVGKFTESMLFGVPWGDLGVTLAAIATVGLLAFAAGYFPARRAARIDPMQALRYE